MASFNWVNHTFYETPSILTIEDLSRTDPKRIQEFHTGVKTLFLIWTTQLPAELFWFVRKVKAVELPDLLSQVLASGEYMDLGFFDEYFYCANDLSNRMRGYPKDSLIKWRGLRARQANSGHANPQVILNANKMTVQPALPTAPATTFLQLPEEMRSQIYRVLLCRDFIEVGDWSISAQPSGAFRRTEYDVHYYGEKRRTTYTVRDKARRIVHLNILLVSKLVHYEAAKIFYRENTFKFRGTAESSLSFFHDRASKLRILAKVSMRFSCERLIKFKGCYNSTCPIPLPPYTNMAAWRRIFNLFVHSSPGLEDFELVIDSSFWEEAAWTDGPTAIFDKPLLCEPWTKGQNHPPPGQDWVVRNFLQHVARLGGINFRLTIEGTDGDTEKENFRKQLQSLIQTKTFARPYLADDESPRCSCKKRYLPETCIWDKEGKMRRGPPVNWPSTD